MNKNKYLGAAWIGFCVIGLAVGGVLVWRVQHGGQKANSLRAASSEAGAVSGNSIKLNQAGELPSDSGGLSVSSSGNSAGQLGSTSGQSLIGGSRQTSGGSESSGPTLPDPSTFAEYEKYKNATGALFGDIQVGDGATLGTGQKAAVAYKGFLTNGQVFDGSRTDSQGKLQPFVFTEGAHEVIAGWEQGLAGMKVGGIRLLIVPPALGYGTTPQGSIPANSVLVFEVQLLEVQ